MHAYLIVGRNTGENIKDLIKQVSANQAINFSIEKIEMVRDLGKFLRLTQTSKVAIIIKDIDLASVESQNAFLKNLEEPQKNIVFILTAKNDFSVLPTILSRCQILRTGKKEYLIRNTEAETFSSIKTGEKLKIISNLKKREDALEFVEDIIFSQHHLLTEKKSDYIKGAFILKTAQNTLNNLNANGNVTLQLTNFVVQLDTADSL